eukprot:g37849.t1
MQGPAARGMTMPERASTRNTVVVHKPPRAPRGKAAPEAGGPPPSAPGREIEPDWAKNLQPHLLSWLTGLGIEAVAGRSSQGQLEGRVVLPGEPRRVVLRWPCTPQEQLLAEKEIGVPYILYDTPVLADVRAYEDELRQIRWTLRRAQNLPCGTIYPVEPGLLRMPEAGSGGEHSSTDDDADHGENEYFCLVRQIIQQGEDVGRWLAGPQKQAGELRQVLIAVYAVLERYAALLGGTNRKVWLGTDLKFGNMLLQLGIRPTIKSKSLVTCVTAIFTGTCKNKLQTSTSYYQEKQLPAYKHCKENAHLPTYPRSPLNLRHCR